MPLLPDPSRLTSADPEVVEQRMRRALGLTGDRVERDGPSQPEQPRPTPEGRPTGRTSAGKPRHRFVQDGAVPVTLVSRRRPDEADGPPARHAATEAALQDERAARARAEQALQEALATVRDLQTKLGHAELAQREASEAAQAARDAADALRATHQEREVLWQADLAAERAARATPEAALAGAVSAGKPAKQTRSVAAPAAAVQDAAAEATMAAAKPAPKGTRKGAATSRQREPQPVRWWLKSAKRR